MQMASSNRKEGMLIWLEGQDKGKKKGSAISSANSPKSYPQTRRQGLSLSWVTDMTLEAAARMITTVVWRRLRSQKAMEDFTPMTLIFKDSLNIFPFPGSSVGKESACSAEDPGSIPGSRRSPGERNGNPLQYPCLENPHGPRSLMGYSPWGCKAQQDRAINTFTFRFISKPVKI